MILALIAACEVAFWLVLAGGLLVRYALHRPRLGMVILAAVPAVDVVLLSAVLWHLWRGGTANIGHALAAFYLGFSLAYGRRLVSWLDVRLVHVIAGGAKPVRLTGAAYTRQCWGDVRRTFLACLFAAAFSALVVWLIDDPVRTAALKANYPWAIGITAVEMIVAVSYTVWPRKSESVKTRERQEGSR